jgi:hypothetical protein
MLKVNGVLVYASTGGVVRHMADIGPIAAGSQVDPNDAMFDHKASREKQASSSPVPNANAMALNKQ